MSETEGITLSVVDEVVGHKAEKLISTDDKHQCNAAIELPVAAVTTEDSDYAMHNSGLSSETMQNTLDNNESLNFEIKETKDQAMPALRDEVLEESNSGECRNILPILIEHLHTALQLSTINQKPTMVVETSYSDGLTTQLSSGHSNSQHTTEDSTKLLQSSSIKMDLNFFQDLLLADIKTALVRLQDVLCRVDVDALCRYSSGLEPCDKLHLLQMISNLATDLRMVKLEDVPHSIVPTNRIRKHHPRGRDRHTIGVSSEELARARKWLEERGPSVNAPITSSSISSIIIEPHSVITPQQENIISSAIEITREQTFDTPRACNKHMKDAINQQQSLQSRSRDMEVISPIITIPDSNMTADMSVGVGFNGWVDTSTISTTRPAASFMMKSCNKFTAKKSKIKRANTIDIPNYVKLQAENYKQSSSSGLRRPIDISDRFSWNPPQINNMTIPSFEPKTENDRKFLALINRNIETSGIDTSSSQSPFKSFNYRQTSSVADKNWKSRFSNIKTTFDKSPTSAPLPNNALLQKKIRDDKKPSREYYSKERETESARVVTTSFTLSPPMLVPFVSRNNFSPPKFPSFTHAASSPFQTIKTCQKNIIHSVSPSSSVNYLPACASSGMLRAKLKMFDRQDRAEDPPPKVKNEYPRMNFFQHTKKVIQSDSNSKPTLRTNMRIQDNSFNRSLNDNYSRRSTISHADMVDLNKYEEGIQRRQSVAVQTVNRPIEVNRHVLQTDRHDSSAILRQGGFHSNHEVSSPQLPTSSPVLIPPPPPSISLPLKPLALPPIALESSYPEIGDSVHLSPNRTDLAYEHVLVAENSRHDITDKIAEKYCNLNTYLDEDGNNKSNNNSNNGGAGDNNISNKSSIDDTFNTIDHSFMNDENIENQDISNDGIVTRYTSAIVTVEKSPSPSRTFPPIQLTNCSCEQSIVNIKPSFPSSHNVKQHNMLQQSVIHLLQCQDDEYQRSNRMIKPNPSCSTVRFEQKYNSPPFNPSLVQSPSIEPEHVSCGPLIESNNTQEKINLFEGRFVGRNKCPTEKPVPSIHSRIWPAIPNSRSSTINITNTSYSKLCPRFHDCPPSVSPSSIPFKYQIGPGDSSDEYLVSCASRPHRSIVLSKSESWHQLAMSKKHIQVPQQMQHQSQQKPAPKTTLHLSKRSDDTSSDKLKKMEEKVQRYFHSSSTVPTTPRLKTEESINQFARRSFSPRKSQGTLARSHTMPHIHDELSDIDKQFDSLFEEATHDSQN